VIPISLSGIPVDIPSTQKILDLILNVPHGPLRMNPDLANEVEASISFSRCNLKSNESAIKLEFFARSSSQSQMDKTYQRLVA